MSCEILLLATFHMANPNADMVNLDADDVLAPRRQAEITEVVDGLQRFQPTKVAVEHPHDDESVVEAYRARRDGGRALGRSETEQIGFRLASRCGHDRIFPIDVTDTFYEEDIERLIGDPAHADRWRRMRADAEQSVARLATTLRDGTVGDALRFANQPEEKAAMLAPYLDSLLPIASTANWAGPDMVANWYRRNFKIAANIHAIAEDRDRIVVVYGAGHVPVLEHALRQSRFRLVDPLDYLPR